MAAFWHTSCWVLRTHVSNVSAYLYVWLILPGPSLRYAHLLAVFLLSIAERRLDNMSEFLHGEFFVLVLALLMYVGCFCGIGKLRLEARTQWYP